MKGRETDIRDSKLSDLRARENKLKKMEEQLKIKERSLEDTNKDKVKLEHYIKTLEARNNELEMTVKTLQRRIDTLGIDNKAQSLQNNQNRQNRQHLGVN